MKASRRHFLKSAAACSIGFAGLQQFAANKSMAGATKATGYGELVKDPRKILDLPEGFSYRIVSKAGDKMSDGLITPGAPDGMAAFPAEDGRTVLIRNHEISPGAKAETGPFGQKNELFAKLDIAKVYDSGKKKGPNLGGTTSLVFNTKTQKVERSYLSLAGSLRNCAGGPTPWNSWITCEETVVTTGPDCRENHGFNFEVPASTDIKLANPVPLRDMGRFNHEAIAVDPKSGIIYQTEDRPDSLIYRFIPNQPGKLAAGGKLQALGVGKRLLDTRNWTRQTIEVGEKRSTRWIDLDDVASQSDLLRYRGSTSGAATFARGEGMWYSDGIIYFACTSGGKAKRGQIWKYHVSPNEGQPGETDNPG
ncbi:MAG: alkaline phosphatase PhoX, partial [Limisphaerales bacterium]